MSRAGNIHNLWQLNSVCVCEWRAAEMENFILSFFIPSSPFGQEQNKMRGAFVVVRSARCTSVRGLVFVWQRWLLLINWWTFVNSTIFGKNQCLPFDNTELFCGWIVWQTEGICFSYSFFSFVNYRKEENFF